MGREPLLYGRIREDVTLQDLLTHLYVLIPVLDAESTTGSDRMRSRSCCGMARDGSSRIPNGR